MSTFCNEGFIFFDLITSFWSIKETFQHVQINKIPGDGLGSSTGEQTHSSKTSLLEIVQIVLSATN